MQACRRFARPPNKFSDAETAALDACRNAAADLKPVQGFGAEETEFWRQFLESMTTQVEMHVAFGVRGGDDDRNHRNLRDRQMAKNLVWLAQKAYPERKLIVWAHAFHLMRNQKQVAVVTEPGKTPTDHTAVSCYEKSATMGDDIWKELGDETYNLFFTAGEGEHGTIRVA